MASTDDVMPIPAARRADIVQLAEQFAHDMSVIIGRPVGPDDLLNRRDGAASALSGILALAGRPRREVAARLVQEWVSAGAVQSAPAPPVAAPVTLQLASLTAPSGERLLDGINLQVVADGASRLTQWARTAAHLCGGMPEVHFADLDERKPRPLPGWAARIHVLTAIESAGRETPSNSGDDLAKWVTAVHEAAARVYVENAPSDSLWQQVQHGVRSEALAMLATASRGVDVDLDRSADEKFWGTAMDRSLSQRLPIAGVATGAVLQVVRLPYCVDGEVQRGIALIADRAAQD